MTQTAHLTEDQLQGAADATLDAEQMRLAYGHLATCESCAADVARLRTVMTRAREANPGAPSLGDLWPAVRSRIEESKVVRPDAFAGPAGGARSRAPWLAMGSVALAATLLVAALAQMQDWRPRSSDSSQQSADVAFASAADSTRVYEDESRRLLNDLEMQRAMMGPSASASLNGDLAIIDRSIAEQKEALVRDPHNVALERLLASSYRQKVELLRRANNAS
jgi:anti-sigma factor RsiW